MTTHMQGKDPVVFSGSRKLNIEITDLNIVDGNYIAYVGIFDREAYRPIAVEAVDCTIHTGLEVHNSVIHLNSRFVVK